MGIEVKELIFVYFDAFGAHVRFCPTFLFAAYYISIAHRENLNIKKRDSTVAVSNQCTQQIFLTLILIA